jgi:hypothetical protein
MVAVKPQQIVPVTWFDDYLDYRGSTYRWNWSTSARLYSSLFQRGSIRYTPAESATWNGRLQIWARCTPPRSRHQRNHSTCTTAR